MRVFELKPDGHLTKKLINEIGAEYTIAERIKNKIFGVGQLRYISGNSILDEFYNRHHHTIKTHFDWTKKGAILRVRTMGNQYAVGLNQEGFKKIVLTKNPDSSYEVPDLPFWIRMQMSTPLRTDHWLRNRDEQYIPGNCTITLFHNDNVYTFECASDLWQDCLATFNLERIKDILTIEVEKNSNSKNLKR